MSFILTPTRKFPFHFNIKVISLKSNKCVTILRSIKNIMYFNGTRFRRNLDTVLLRKLRRNLILQIYKTTIGENKLEIES